MVAVKFVGTWIVITTPEKGVVFIATFSPNISDLFSASNSLDKNVSIVYALITSLYTSLIFSLLEPISFYDNSTALSSCTSSYMILLFRNFFLNRLGGSRRLLTIESISTI